MSSKSQLLYQQRQWSESCGLKPDDRGYLDTVEANLFRPLNEFTRNAFEKGRGSELKDTPSRPAKMKALLSSSALAVNVFDSWVGKDTTVLLTAFGLSSKNAVIKFEEQYPTGLNGSPPNLDVVLELADGHVIAIESKFSEWLTPKSKSKAPFKPKYFPENRALWKERALPRAQHLAEEINNGKQLFRYLDAPQLLKHALGMATNLGERFSLFYIYFDWPGAESEIHGREIQRFAAVVDAVMRFKAMSYQVLFSLLKEKGGLDDSYRSYLNARYFSGKS